MRSSHCLCLSTRCGSKKQSTAIPAMARLKGSQEFAEIMLPKTMAFAAKYQGPITKPNAPTRSANTRGKRKQEEMSTVARSISSCGNVMRKFHSQMQKAMNANQNVISGSPSGEVFSFIEICQGQRFPDP